MKFFRSTGAWLARSAMSLLLALPLFSSAATTITYFHNDASGSPIMATDASGALVWKESYRPYGSKWNNAPGSNANAIGYAGKPYDAGAGLSYMDARYYDPMLGRFMAVDPAPPNPVELHSLNRYTYANNNPYRYVDPDGKSPVAVARLEWIVVTEIAKRLGAPVLGSAIGIGIYDLTHSDEKLAPPPADKPKTTGVADSGNRFPDRELPRDKDGNPIPESKAEGPHTQLGQKQGRKEKYDQAREFDANGRPVRDIDFTDHGRPKNHPNPHQHRYLPNPTGGTPQHGPAEPLS